MLPLFQDSPAVLFSGFNSPCAPQPPPICCLKDPLFPTCPPPPSPLSASSQPSRTNGTGSALAGQATRIAACPPSTRSCRLRSCPSRYRGTLHPPGDLSLQKRISAPSLSCPAKLWSNRWKDPWISRRGNLSPGSCSQFSGKDSNPHLVLGAGGLWGLHLESQAVFALTEGLRSLSLERADEWTSGQSSKPGLSQSLAV